MELSEMLRSRKTPFKICFSGSMSPRNRIALLQQPGSFRRGDGFAPKPTLTAIDTGSAKKKSFFPGFHSFSHRAQPERSRQGDDAAQHSRCGLIRENRVDQRMVDLENIKTETDNLHQAAVTGAEIIDRDTDPRLPCLLQRRTADGG